MSRDNTTAYLTGQLTQALDDLGGRLLRTTFPPSLPPADFSGVLRSLWMVSRVHTSFAALGAFLLVAFLLVALLLVSSSVMLKAALAWMAWLEMLYY